MELNNTLLFLEELSNNNNKEWFDDNRKRYQNLRVEFIEFVQSLIDGISSFDASLTGVDPKKCIFRINRDVRFSNDKSPYKTNFGALLGSLGKKTEGSGYYIHLQPGNSFLGGGIYQPNPANLASIRQEIDYNAQSLRNLLDSDSFQEMFGSIQGNKVKTAPKGYSKDHPAINLLRLKNFYVIRNFSDSNVCASTFHTEALNTYREAQKFNDFINHALS